MNRPVPASIAAIIATHNRADLLRRTLESLTRQTLPRADFEAVIVDDGSADQTREVVQSFLDRLPIRYAFQRNAGLASARNHGVYLTLAPILLFLDDDDVAEPALLAEHVATHRKHPKPSAAVLGYTRLDPSIAGDPLMHFVTEVGCFLFSYPNVSHGQQLDFEYFWGGRSSCKRALLIEHGVFNPVFRFGCEDIELAYRLSPHGFHVVYNENAVTTMVRRVTFDEFCSRLGRQGQSNFVFSRIHTDPIVQRWTEVEDFEEKWQRVAPLYENLIGAGRRIDCLARRKRAAGFELTEADTAALHHAYFAAFRAAKLKGIANAAGRTGATASEVQEKGDELPMVNRSRSSSDTSHDLSLANTALHAQADTIKMLRDQSARQQQVIECQSEAIRRLEAQRQEDQSARQQQVIDIASLESVVSQRNQEVADCRQGIATLERELASTRAYVRDLLRSVSWRVTAPIRSVARLLMGRSD
jgi:glycosyltransferase involved in cell wall biosynthesis